MARLSQAQARRLGIAPAPKSKPKKPRRVYQTKALWDAAGLLDGTLLITIPASMPSLNEWSRWHWAKQKRYLDRLTQDLTMLVMAFRLPRLEKARVEVIHYHRVRRRRDPDNAVPKFLLDALRYAGVLADDNAGVLELPEPVFRVDRERWRTEVLIRRK